MAELEERIRAIEDRSQIVELTGRYCHMARTGNVEGIVDLFCEDGVLEANDTRVEGREKLLGMYREAFAGLSVLPCVHNHTVELDGDVQVSTNRDAVESFIAIGDDLTGDIIKRPKIGVVDSGNHRTAAAVLEDYAIVTQGTADVQIASVKRFSIEDERLNVRPNDVLVGIGSTAR